jgi:nucleoid DNA-binding protein
MKEIVNNASEAFNVSKKDAKAMVDFVIEQIVNTIVNEKSAKITGLGQQTRKKRSQPEDGCNCRC